MRPKRPHIATLNQVRFELGRAILESVRHTRLPEARAQ